MEKLKQLLYAALLILCMFLISACATQSYRGKAEVETYPEKEGRSYNPPYMVPGLDNEKILIARW